jgi:ankyrin repeat protein
MVKHFVNSVKIIFSVFIFLIIGITDLNAANNRKYAYGAAQLSAAIQREDIEQIKKMITAGADINDETGLFDKPPICAALLKGNDEIVRLLIKAGANVNRGDNENAISLHYAVYGGKCDFIDDLIKAGAKINAASKYGDTPLMSAAGSGQIDCLKKILQYGAIINLKDTSGRSALWWAIFTKKDMDGICALHLIEKGAAADAETINFALREKKISAARALYNKKIPYSKEDMSDVLYTIADQGYIEGIEFLLELGVDVNYVPKTRYSTVIEYACSAGRDDAVVLLLGKGADPGIIVKKDSNVYSTTVIAAARKLKTETMKMILEKRGKIPADEINLALEEALMMGKADNAKLLISAGADISRIRGKITLNLASKWGNPDALNIIIEKRKDITRKDLGDALIEALEYRDENRESNMLYLIEKGATVDNLNDAGNNALLMASSRGLIKIVKLLIEKGSDVNLKNKYDRTPLKVAQKAEIKDMLKKAGAKK